MLKERMAFAVKHALRIHLQRRHPLRHIGIDAKWQVEKRLHLRLVGRVDFDNLNHEQVNA